ncbi:hypothetical protein DFJ73DRAFT_831037 [Zopfochytrium polystomum]|nr:hypothetical protein DFJ73DRAFT_831037 [Zopfochytrium polystomum]
MGSVLSHPTPTTPSSNATPSTTSTTSTTAAPTPAPAGSSATPLIAPQPAATAPNSDNALTTLLQRHAPTFILLVPALLLAPALLRFPRQSLVAANFLALVPYLVSNCGVMLVFVLIVDDASPRFNKRITDTAFQAGVACLAVYPVVNIAATTALLWTGKAPAEMGAGLRTLVAAPWVVWGLFWSIRWWSTPPPPSVVSLALMWGYEAFALWTAGVFS